MGFDDFLKDLMDDIDWGDVLGSVFNWIANNPNIYQAGIEGVISLIRIANKVRGMSKKEAKEVFGQNVEEMRGMPDLPMDFEVNANKEV